MVVRKQSALNNHTGLGIWGVTAGANAYVQQQKDDVRSRAVDAVTGFQVRSSSRTHLARACGFRTLGTRGCHNC